MKNRLMVYAWWKSNAAFIYGMIMAGGGWTVSEVEIMEGWIDIGIKFLSFIVLVITAVNKYNKNKREEQEFAMKKAYQIGLYNTPDESEGGGDNEDGSSSGGPGS